jgi:stage V sporulation protein AA
MESQQCIYVRLHNKTSMLPNQTVTIGDVADMISNRLDEDEIRAISLHALQLSDGNRFVIHSLDVIKAVQEYDSQITVQCLGPEQTLIYVQAGVRKPHLLLVFLVWIILFIGSGLAIMNFHIDVSMQQTHERIYELVTGRKNSHPLLIQIPYSIGVGAGMVLFFNHLFRKRFNDEPSPLELEMFLYQQNIDQYVLANETDRRDRPE